MFLVLYLVSSDLVGGCCGDESVGPPGCFGHREPHGAGQDLQLTPGLTLTTAGESSTAKQESRAGLTEYSQASIV